MPSSSILNSVKKVLGLPESDSSFDLDIVMHINSALATLTQIGVGPDEGFAIEDDSATWDAFIGDQPKYATVKTYVYLKVRLVWDPPGTSYALESMKEQIDELVFRLNVEREGTKWVAPSL